MGDARTNDESAPDQHSRIVEVDVPEHRRVRPILQMIQSVYGRPARPTPFDPSGLPAEMRESISEIVSVNQGLDALEALASEHESQQRNLELELFACPSLG